MIGIGVDVTTISRIEKSLGRPQFAERVFTLEERELLNKKSAPAQTAAANFAAKEAFGKALGTGLSGFSWQELSVLRDKNGAPYFAYTGALLNKMEQHGWRALVSLTHEGDAAAAFVILEEGKP
ncbi:MAG: holo-ACP synthase [Oscillospiraceae bacterium]|nr:holo-ACP synthase [Oscillospiraceae bacterium]